MIQQVLRSAPKFFWKYGIVLALTGFIAYQLAFTWVPLWINASRLTGTDVSDFTVENEQGQRIALREFRGAPLILNFWATWCTPCRFEIPELIKAYPTLQEQGKQLLGINLREPWSAIRPYREEMEIPYPVFKDNGTLSDALGIGVIPALVIVDADGKLQRIVFGFRPWVRWYLKWWL